ncbi:MAG: archaeosine biosynthesis radical SAM protein RaSEA [Deltaproteobacteria bacterium]|nr:archaeosine biosynthesis radical SAM protein RaSEA [Deltaproteobacteria bacterium]
MTHEPRRVEWTPARVGDGAGSRLMVILAAPGCAWYARSGGCFNCSFPQSLGTGGPVSADDFAAQIEAAIDRIPTATGARRPVAIDLFVSGSFFNPDEVSVEAQKRMLQRAARVPRCARILVESRPEYVTADALHRAVQAAGSIPLEIAIGLESADDAIRAKKIHKGFTWRQFEQAAHLVAAAKLSLFVYVLLKPMDCTEAESISDALETCQRVAGLGKDLGCGIRIGLEPCFVAPNTKLEQAFFEGRYRPPWLWSVVEVAQRACALAPIHVGLSDEGLQPARAAHNCDRCSASVIEALAAFNLSQDARPLAELDCECKAEWRQALE